MTNSMNAEEQKLYDILKNENMEYLIVDHKAGSIIFVMKDKSYVTISTTVDEDISIDYSY